MALGLVQVVQASVVGLSQSSMKITQRKLLPDSLGIAYPRHSQVCLPIYACSRSNLLSGDCAGGDQLLLVHLILLHAFSHWIKRSKEVDGQPGVEAVLQMGGWAG